MAELRANAAASGQGKHIDVRNNLVYCYYHQTQHNGREAGCTMNTHKDKKIKDQHNSRFSHNTCSKEEFDALCKHLEQIQNKGSKGSGKGGKTPKGGKPPKGKGKGGSRPSAPGPNANTADRIKSVITCPANSFRMICKRFISPQGCKMVTCPYLYC